MQNRKLPIDNGVTPDFGTRPLTPDNWNDLVTVFGGGRGRGDCGRCWCMWWRSRPGTIGEFQKIDNKKLFRNRVVSGPPPGLVGYWDDDPVGWVQVGPRSDVPEWNVVGRVTAPLDLADADNPDVWGISCFVVRAGYRRAGHAARLLDSAILWARAGGARRVEACPVETDRRRPATALYHGPASLFRTRGFTRVAERRVGRPLMRLSL